MRRSFFTRTRRVSFYQTRENIRVLIDVLGVDILYYGHIVLRACIRTTSLALSQHPTIKIGKIFHDSENVYKSTSIYVFRRNGYSNNQLSIMLVRLHI